MGLDGPPGDNFLLPNPLLSPNPLTQDFPQLSLPPLKDWASDGSTLLSLPPGTRVFTPSSPTLPPVLRWRKDAEEMGLGGGGAESLP